MVRDEQQEAIGHPSPVAAKKGIFDGIFDDEEEVLSPEQAHAKASKDALRMQKQREQFLDKSREVVSPKPNEGRQGGLKKSAMKDNSGSNINRDKPAPPNKKSSFRFDAAEDNTVVFDNERPAEAFLHSPDILPVLSPELTSSASHPFSSSSSSSPFAAGGSSVSPNNGGELEEEGGGWVVQPGQRGALEPLDLNNSGGFTIKLPAWNQEQDGGDADEDAASGFKPLSSSSPSPSGTKRIARSPSFGNTEGLPNLPSFDSVISSPTNTDTNTDTTTQLLPSSLPLPPPPPPPPPSPPLQQLRSTLHAPSPASSFSKEEKNGGGRRAVGSSNGASNGGRAAARLRRQIQQTEEEHVPLEVQQQRKRGARLKKKLRTAFDNATASWNGGQCLRDDTIDENSEGPLMTVFGLKLAAAMLGQPDLSLGDCQQILDFVDFDADGLISFDEFVVALQSEVPEEELPQSHLIKSRLECLFADAAVALSAEADKLAEMMSELGLLGEEGQDLESPLQASERQNAHSRLKAAIAAPQPKESAWSSSMLPNRWKAKAFQRKGFQVRSEEDSEEEEIPQTFSEEEEEEEEDKDEGEGEEDNGVGVEGGEGEEEEEASETVAASMGQTEEQEMQERFDREYKEQEVKVVAAAREVRAMDSMAELAEAMAQAGISPPPPSASSSSSSAVDAIFTDDGDGRDVPKSGAGVPRALEDGGGLDGGGCVGGSIRGVKGERSSGGDDIMPGPPPASLVPGISASKSSSSLLPFKAPYEPNAATEGPNKEEAPPDLAAAVALPGVSLAAAIADIGAQGDGELLTEAQAEDRAAFLALSEEMGAEAKAAKDFDEKYAKNNQQHEIDGNYDETGPAV